MSFGAPWGLLGLLAVPAVVLLHMFRRRLPPRRVAGLFLFAPDSMAAQAGRKRTRLLRSASLWLELAAAVALALWLAELRLGVTGRDRQLVVVVDDSASMAAVGGDGETFAGRARKVVAASLTAAGAPTAVTVIASGARPRLLAGPRAVPAVATAALAAWTPSAPHHDFGPALDLGRDLADAAADLLFVTDAPDLAVPAGCRVAAVGERLENGAIVNARRLPEAAGGELLFVDVLGLVTSPRPRRLTVLSRLADGGERALATTELELQPDRLARFETRLPAAAGPVRVVIDGDPLAIDDSCLLLPPPRPAVRVAVDLPAAAAAALQLDAAIAAIPAVQRVGLGAVADLRLAAGPGTAAVEVLIAAGEPPIEPWLGPFLLDHRHELTAGLTFDGVIWSAGTGTELGRSLVSTGDRSLLTEELAGDRVRYRLWLAPERSNLATSPDWPILLSNVVDCARQRLPGPAAVNVRAGDDIVWRQPPEADLAAALELRGPGGEIAAGHGGRVVTFAASRPGLHRLWRGDAELARYAVQFVDPVESDLRGCASIDVPAAAAAVVPAPATPPAGDRERAWLAGLLLLVVVLDWWVLGAAVPASQERGP